MAPNDSGDGTPTRPDDPPVDGPAADDAVADDRPGNGDTTDGSADAPTVETLAAQVERLESEVADLRETVQAQDRTIQFLAGDADLDPLEASCPDCGHAPLRRESGMTWKQLICDDCGQKWYL
jgi:hypothetical protein